MRKTAFVILAHPDDESFGPSGTIALLSQTHDIYLFCATKGQAGEDYSVKDGMNLQDKRTIELQKSSAILGVKKVIFLGYRDTHLDNSIYHEAAEKITSYVKRLHPDRIITYEPRGISGHLDHIAMSMISSYVYIKNEDIRELHYFCLDEFQRGVEQNYYIYLPPGYPDSQISKRVDIASVLNKKIAAIKTHVSQMKDVERMMKRLKNGSTDECFIILRKE